MAKLIRLLFVTAILLFNSASYSYAQAYFPDTAWTRCYGGSLDESGLYIQETFDGGYVVLGTSNSNDGDLVNALTGGKTWILKLDSLGNIEWQKYFPYQSYYTRSLRQTSDGGYVIAGQKFTKLKPNGDIDWQLNKSSHFVIQTLDDGYVLFNDLAGDLSVGTVTKVSVVGTTEWTMNVSEHFVSMEATRDSGVLLGGYVTVDGPQFDFAVYTHIAKDGAIVRHGGGGMGKYSSCKQTLDNKYILTGAECVQYASPIYSFLRKSDSLQIWLRQMLDKYPHDVIQNIDASYVYCGEDTSNQAFITKTTEIGTTIISRSYGGSTSDQFRIIAPTRDSGYIAIGSTFSNDGDVWGNHGGRDLWIVKWEQDTSVHTPPLPVTENVSRIHEIKVYPTLTNGVVNVLLPQGYEQAKVDVYNIVGQAVDVKATGSGSKRSIDISEQPAGQYILRVMNGGEQKSFRITLAP